MQALTEIENKRWLLFDLLAARLNSEGYDIVWIGGSDDKDINESLSSKIGINTTGLFTIRELACLGKFATFAVTNDSAPMHILSSCNIPVFGILVHPTKISIMQLATNLGQYLLKNQMLVLPLLVLIRYGLNWNKQS